MLTTLIDPLQLWRPYWQEPNGLAVNCETLQSSTWLTSPSHSVCVLLFALTFSIFSIVCLARPGGAVPSGQFVQISQPGSGLSLGTGRLLPFSLLFPLVSFRFLFAFVRGAFPNASNILFFLIILHGAAGLDSVMRWQQQKRGELYDRTTGAAVSGFCNSMATAKARWAVWSYDARHAATSTKNYNNQRCALRSASWNPLIGGSGTSCIHLVVNGSQFGMVETES